MKPHPKLRLTGRFAGRGLITVGIMMLGADLVRALERGSYKAIALGELWYLGHAGSLNGLQAGVQRYLDPALWDRGIAPVLLLPCWLIFTVLGLVIAFLCRPREPSRLWL